MLGVKTKEIFEVSLYTTTFMWWWKHVEPRVTTAKQYGIKNEVLLGTHWELVELFGNLMGGNNKAPTLN
jgi:hypothetical protein